MPRFWTVLLLACCGCTSRSSSGSSPVPPTPTGPPTPAASSSSQRTEALTPQLVEFPSGASTLHGFLYRPTGGGPFPAIVFNHGSEALPGAKEGQAQFYVPHGFVLFVPHRRGHGRSKDAGAHIDTKLGDPQAFADELVAQSDDVLAAIEYVATQGFVDAKRIAVAGCSLGGIESLFAAQRSTRIVAAVDFAGAAITWARMPPLQERMKQAAREAKVPVFFIQAENDFDTTPSRVLSQEMRSHGKPMRVHIFPPNGSSAKEGHGFCMGGAAPPWGEEVLAFLQENLPAR
nr:hypothetical protein Hi04_10k_c2877_00007 [uncultured bacterium]